MTHLTYSTTHATPPPSSDKASLLYNLETQRATIKVNHSMAVADRDVRMLATYKQEGDNNIDIQLSHAPSKDMDVSCIYNVGSSDVTVKGIYTMDEKTTVEPECRRMGKNGAINWNIKAVHRMSSADRIEAHIHSEDPSVPRISYTRTQDGVDLTIGAPLSANIVADASVKINRCVWARLLADTLTPPCLAVPSTCRRTATRSLPPTSLVPSRLSGGEHETMRGACRAFGSRARSLFITLDSGAVTPFCL